MMKFIARVRSTLTMVTMSKRGEKSVRDGREYQAVMTLVVEGTTAKDVEVAIDAKDAGFLWLTGFKVSEASRWHKLAAWIAKH